MVYCFSYTLNTQVFMTLIDAFILGLLQGLTEFLPVSSSAHIQFAKLLLGVTGSEMGALFDLTCHLGTLIAMLFFLKQEIRLLFRQDRRKLYLLFLATLPLIPCYFLLKPVRDLASQPQMLGSCLILTAGILVAGQYFRLPRKHTSSKKKEIGDVFCIGALQSAALIPGISRSASTISCAKVLGWNPKEAVRFSFLLSIPTIIGGNCLELLKLYLSSDQVSTAILPQCCVGFFSSLLFGSVMVRFAISFLEKGDLKPFAWYCLSVGIALTFYINLFH